jgi:DNA-binding CsgD family transcriptional regulator/PAS domain-containing protein
MAARHIRIQSVVLEGLRALESPEVLPHVLRELAKAFDSPKVIIFSPLAGPAAAERPHYQLGLQEKFFDDYFSWVWKLDAWRTAIASKAPSLAGHGILSQNLVARADLHKTAFYGEHLRPMGLEHMVSALVGSPNDPLAIAIARESTQRAFTAVDLTELQLTRFQLEVFVRGYEARHQSQRYQRNQAALLDAEVTGLALLDASGTCLVANQRAQSWLGIHPRSNGSLSKLHPKLWHACIDAHTAPGQKACVTFLSPGQQQQLCNVSIEWRTDQEGSKVYLRMTSAAEPSVEARLLRYAMASGLSEMEQRVLRLLIDHNPSEVSAQLGLKVSTVRSHMSSIFLKTGKRRQSELLWALATA